MKSPVLNHEELDPDPFWYKTGVIYEVHVRAFYDRDGDGTGDFRGLTEKLDYLKDLGITAVWLLPFYPSPLKDDGYDIADYYNVHPKYGTLGDFKIFLREAHRRGLRVITELVLNHTSDQHPWFQRARHSLPGSRWRNAYIWSNTSLEYKDARIIFKDIETSNWAWDPVAKAYYWHRFFSHQPDLNYDNPEVREAITKVLDFWLDLGVDGLRLDAVPYLYKREGTNCENLPETHAFLKQLRAHVDQRYNNRMLLAEANQWPEDAVAYFGQGRGDECHMAFHFPLMPRLFMALRMEDRLPIVEILRQTPAIPETSQWALFLRNHDELTLEMVTDEERDYMYRMYAQVRQARLNLGIRRRLAPLLGNDRRRIELLNALLFSLPGTPVLYYGDEIGLGENIYLGDRNGVRTPMQWSSDKNAGFSRANPQSLYLPIILDPEYHYEASNVETQLANPHSLLWWMRRMLALRKRWRALGEGKCEFLQPENRKILSYVLRYQQETILVVANLSRFVQPLELDLSSFKPLVPIELFGRMQFPPITSKPYFLTLGPHAFYWFSLEPSSAAEIHPTTIQAPQIARFNVEGAWPRILEGRARTALDAVLPSYLKTQSWFGSQAGTLKAAVIKDVVPVPLANGNSAFLTIVQVDYLHADTDEFMLPLAFAEGSEAEHIREHLPQLVVAELSLVGPARTGILYDAIGNPAFCMALLRQVSHRRRLKGEYGEIEAQRTAGSLRIVNECASLEPIISKGIHRNSIVFFGDKLVLKLFRRLESGYHPELELGKFLNEKGFANSPFQAGALEYSEAHDRRSALAALSRFIPHAVGARAFTLDALSRYFDRVITWVAQGREIPSGSGNPVNMLHVDLPPEVLDDIGTYLESARLLGVRTAELHLALASGESDTLAPEPFTPHFQRGLFQTMRGLAIRNLWLLQKRAGRLSPALASLAQSTIEREGAIVQLYQSVFEGRLNAKRIRTHGDCHLDHILWTGMDFVFIDFEGDPWAPLSQRQIKRSPLRDVASLVRSFYYAANEGLLRHAERGSIPHENLPKFEVWVRHWCCWVSIAFLKAYFLRLDSAELYPHDPAQLRAMLRAYLSQQVMKELAQELSRNTDQFRIPLQDILLFLE
jgi:maltose alpha-D-glucosyltransferase / alpha-amylase